MQEKALNKGSQLTSVSCLGFCIKPQKKIHHTPAIATGVIFFMDIPTRKLIEYYWEKYCYPLALLVTTIVLLTAFFFYSIERSVTGKEIEHEAIVVAANVTHGYGPQGQNVRARLSSGKEVYLNFDGTPINTGDHIIVIEMPKKGGASSNYIYKSKYNK